MTRLASFACDSGRSNPQSVLKVVPAKAGTQSGFEESGGWILLLSPGMPGLSRNVSLPVWSARTVQARLCRSTSLQERRSSHRFSLPPKNPIAVLRYSETNLWDTTSV